MLTLSLIWGSSFILIKKSLLALTPLQTGSLRVLISALAFLPWVIWRRRHIPWKGILPVIVFALCEVGIPPFLYALAQTRIDSSTAGILNSLVPLFTLITGAMFFAIGVAGRDIAGVLLGLAGAILLVGGRDFAFRSADLYGLLVVLATILYAFAGNILQTRLSAVSALDISAMAFVSMGIPASAILMFEGLPEVSAFTLPSLAAVAILSLVGSALAIVLFSRLVQLAGALLASFVTYLIPVVALIWAVADGEAIGALQLLALGSILAGVALVTRPRSGRRRVPDTGGAC